MVRPILSKRKLFNSNKEQFKENEPSQIKSRESHSISSNSYQISTPTHLSRSKATNYSKRSLSDTSSCDKKQESFTKSAPGVDGLKKCNSENAVDALAPGRIVMPMSERQQIALVMQLSSSSPTGKSEDLSCSTPSTPTTPLLGRGLAKRNERGETPLHVAAIKGDSEKVAQLISQGANVNAADYAGWTALHEACNRGFIIIASLLIKGGADVNAKGFDNDTPLHDACVNNNYQIVRLLLTSGALPDFVNLRGKSPIDTCRSPKILLLLEEAKLGKLEPTEISTSISTKVSVEDIEQTLHKLGFISLNNNWPSIQGCETTSDMSRKTPPNNKPEEKLNLQVSVASPTNVNTGTTASVSSSGSSSSSNSRPVSPRVPMRLQHGSRTPDKLVSNVGSKTSSESDDIYEFRCSKDDTKETETVDKPQVETASAKSPDSLVTPSDVKSDKRPRDNEQMEEEEESKRKRKKEETKEGGKGSSRGVGSSSRPSSADKPLKVNQRPILNTGKSSSSPMISTASTSTGTTNTTITPSTTGNNSITTNSSITSTSDQKKSPSNSASNSPKPASSTTTINKSDKNDSDNEDIKPESNPWAPKVPPLKIVLAPCSLSEQETSSQNGKSANGRQLPYVVSSSSGTAEDKEKENLSSTDSTNKEAVFPKEEVSNKDSNKSYSPLPVVTSTATSAAPTTTTTEVATPTSSEGSPCSVATSPIGSSSYNSTSSLITTTSDKGSATRITRSHRGGNSGNSSNSDDGQLPSVKIEPKVEEVSSNPEVIHPRKRKIKMKEPEVEPSPPPASTPDQPQQPITNCYEMFLKIRKQVERRRKLLFPVQPKPPQGFKDYLMNRCSYVLANNANSHLAVPLISPPSTLAQPLKELFSEQEQERYKLRLQQLIEKEKLVLSVEQEILRVHGRAARALANQVLPFSVCTILKDEEVYNVISPEQEEKDRNARSRYNGRLFLSWLQDVDDKWEKIKEAMVLRHHNEAESLHAVQKMDWEWKLKELGMVEAITRASIEELHVPMVQVADFDLLPA